MITIKRQQWTYLLRCDPRSPSALLRLGADLDGVPGLVVTSYSSIGASLEVEDLHDRTRTVAEFVELVRGIAGGARVEVVAPPRAARGRAA